MECPHPITPRRPALARHHGVSTTAPPRRAITPRTAYRREAVPRTLRAPSGRAVRCRGCGAWSRTGQCPVMPQGAPAPTPWVRSRPPATRTQPSPPPPKAGERSANPTQPALSEGIRHAGCAPSDQADRARSMARAVPAERARLAAPPGSLHPPQPHAADAGNSFEERALDEMLAAGTSTVRTDRCPGRPHGSAGRVRCLAPPQPSSPLAAPSGAATQAPCGHVPGSGVVTGRAGSVWVAKAAGRPRWCWR